MPNLRPLVLVLPLVAALGCGASAAPAGSAAPTGGAAVSPEPDASATADAPAPDAKPSDDAKPDADKEKAPPPAQAAATDSTALTGKLSQKDIQAIVLKNSDLFNDCYSIGAGKSQQFVATVTIKATIGPKGTVNEAKVQKSTSKNQKVDQCVADSFKKIQFPAPKDGATSVITFPMEFGGAEEIKK